MTLAELLDFIGVELLDDRTEMLEGESDEVWSDTSIVRRLNEAQRVLCRDAWVLEDTDLDRVDPETGEKICQIQLIENQTDYSFSKHILHIKSMKLSDTDVDMTRVGYNDNRIRADRWEQDPQYWDVNAAVIENSGRPTRYSTDRGTRVVKVRAKPDATAALLQLNMVVVRMPVYKLSLDNTTACPEVPEEYHEMIGQYAAGKLLQHPTVDASMRSLGMTWVKDFEEFCKKARIDRERRQQSMPQFRFGHWVNNGF